MIINPRVLKVNNIREFVDNLYKILKNNHNKIYNRWNNGNLFFDEVSRDIAEGKCV